MGVYNRRREGMARRHLEHTDRVPHPPPSLMLTKYKKKEQILEFKIKNISIITPQQQQRIC